MKLKLAVGDVTREFELKHQGQHLTLTDADGNITEVQFIRRNEHTLDLEIDGHPLRVQGYAGGKQKHVWVGGRHWRYQQLKDGAQTSNDTTGSLSLSIPAVVTEILVQPGDAVNLGDKLVLLESMKMVLSIQAPQDGVVKAISCKVGQSVEPDVPLVVLEEAV